MVQESVLHWAWVRVERLDLNSGWLTVSQMVLQWVQHLEALMAKALGSVWVEHLVVEMAANWVLMTVTLMDTATVPEWAYLKVLELVRELEYALAIEMADKTVVMMAA